MAKHLLTDRKVHNAKPHDKPYRLFDGDGLALWVSPTGVRAWQYRYKHHGKEQTATLGKLDRLTLAQARDAADKARKLAAEGEHLTMVKRTAKLRRRADAANTFASVAADWLKIEAREARWTDDYQGEVSASLRNHLAELDAFPITTITAKTAAPLLRKVDREAPDMARKVRQRLRAILDHAVEEGLIQGNPLPAVRRRKTERQHYPAVSELAGIGEILRAARAADPCKGIQRAHLLLVFTAQRISEVVGATWNEIDLAAGTWSIPRGRMKRKNTERGPHVVPIPPQLLLHLREWREADSPEAVYVCEAPRDSIRSITREAVEKFYRRTLGLAGKHGPHAWRSAFSTVSREAGKDGDSVEAQLDHVVGNKIAAAYDRAKRLALRRELMTWYEATLLAARDGAAVLPIAHKRAK
jgi:integrase